MTADVITLHPEVEGILREVASRPGSVLLRVARGAERAILSDDVVLGGYSGQLRSAERHLLAVHREEVAFALRQAAWARIATVGPRAHLVFRRTTRDVEVEVPALGETIAAGKRARESYADQPPEPEIVTILDALVADVRGDAVRSETLLASAHRLVPSTRGRILAGSAFALAGSHGAALTCFADVIDRGCAADLSAVCWSNLAHVLDEQGRDAEALTAVRRAVRLTPGYIAAEAARLWLAILLGLPDEARSALAALEDCTRAAGALDEVIRRFERGRLDGQYVASSEQRAFVRRLADQTAGQAGRVLHALE
jgi:hypothetical protein